MDHDGRAAMIADGLDPDDPDLIASHLHVTRVLRAHRNKLDEPGRLRDWYLTTRLGHPVNENDVEVGTPST